MSAPSFVPLTCPLCLGELVGRAADIVAFCPPCQIAVRVDGEESLEIPSMAVSVRMPEVPATSEDALIALPFWRMGTVAVPAFHTARPLTLARMASGLLDKWRPSRGMTSPAPLGVRLRPEALPELAALARLEAPPADAPLSLVGVPALVRDQRVHLPGLQGTLYPGDVSEEGVLIEASSRLKVPASV